MDNTNYCTLNQLDRYAGNAPWCISNDRAKTFPSDQFYELDCRDVHRENFVTTSTSPTCKCVSCTEKGSRFTDVTAMNAWDTNYSRVLDSKFPPAYDNNTQCKANMAYFYDKVSNDAGDNWPLPPHFDEASFKKSVNFDSITSGFADTTNLQEQVFMCDDLPCSLEGCKDICEAIKGTRKSADKKKLCENRINSINKSWHLPAGEQCDGSYYQKITEMQNTNETKFCNELDGFRNGLKSLNENCCDGQWAYCDHWTDWNKPACMHARGCKPPQ